MSDRVKIAAVQMEPRLLEKERNLGRCLEALGEAAQNGAKLIVFPECALTGYCFSSLEEATPAAEPLPGPATEAMADRCRQLGVYAVVGLIEASGDSHYNAAALLGPEGLVGSYRKIHLPFLGVDRFLDHGDRPFRVYETEVGRVGLNICYDGMFPESARVMALAAAEIIALPTNWPQGRERVPRLVIPTRAVENRVHYVAADRVGEERGFRFIGQSRIVSAWGDVLAEAGPSEETILYAELDLAQARQKHTIMRPGEFEFDLIADRRPEFYGDIVRQG